MSQTNSSISTTPIKNTQSLSLSGVIPPMVTPLRARDEIDHAGLERLIEHLIQGGCNGLFILGTTGEAPSLSYRLRRELIETVVGLVNKRIPVLVGITDTAFVETIQLAEFATEHGADAAVLTTPYYFPAGQTELLAYVRNIVSEISLPLVLYNMPSLTKVWFEFETLKDLTSIESIIGIKDSSGDLNYFEQLITLKQTRPDWSVMIGPEALLPEAMAIGGDGVVAGGANIAPELFTTCYQSILDDDAPRTAQLHEKILQLQAIYEVGKYASRYIKATKCSLSLLGICSDLPADPFNPFFERERKQVETILKEIGLLTFNPNP